MAANATHTHSSFLPAAYHCRGWLGSVPGHLPFLSSCSRPADASLSSALYSRKETQMHNPGGSTCMLQQHTNGVAKLRLGSTLFPHSRVVVFHCLNTYWKHVANPAKSTLPPTRLQMEPFSGPGLCTRGRGDDSVGSGGGMMMWGIIVTLPGPRHASPPVM